MIITLLICVSGMRLISAGIFDIDRICWSFFFNDLTLRVPVHILAVYFQTQLCWSTFPDGPISGVFDVNGVTFTDLVTLIVN